MFTPSTTTWSSSTLTTVPRRPLSRPAITRTSSPFLILLITFSSKHFGCQGDDLHELRRAQLARHRSKDARADRLQLVRQQHRSVAVEADQRAVRATHAELGAHDDCVVHLALLHLAARNRVANAHLDDIADRRVAPLRAAEHLDAHQAPRAAVVGGIQHRADLDHGVASSAWSAPRSDWGPRSSTFTNRQLLWRDIGRHCSIETRSPVRLSLFSSCASSCVVRRWYLP